MKKAAFVVLAAVLLLSIGTGSASAANSLKAGAAGISADVNDDFVVSGRLFLEKDLAVLASFGFGIKGGDADGVDIGIGAGVRKYLAVDDFAPFVGGRFFLSDTDDGDQGAVSLLGEFGAEYFMHRQLSIEGSIGFGFISLERKTAAGTFTDNTIGTRTFGVSLNFYVF